MRTLVVVRHAKSAWDTDEPDRLRPLAKRGRRQAPESGAWLAAHLANIDLAVVSPATRARATWELIAAELETAPPVRIDEQVYAAWGGGLLDVVRSLPDDAETVALVGHNPGVEGLVADLTGADVRMPTSAVAVVSWVGPWSTADSAPARLRAHGRPPADLRD
ncbi:SixA phosphatase family protein [Nocardia salmonicida]|uniref:SixA phosphatase family protein n=1 Tax=Nocardia salmonicida TaxID=53431 RepID=UPI0033C2BD60